MAEDGKIVYKVVINDSGVEQEASAAGQKAGGAFEEVMVGAARRIGEAFVEMARSGVQAIENIAKAGIEFNAKMEQYETAFTTLLGSEEKAAKVMDQIREDAARTPFDVDSLTQANQMLIAAGISADQARGDVLNLANAIAATGGGSAELSRMASNLQQIQNTGKATAMDIRQFANAGINIYGLLADSMGVTAAEAAEMDVTYEQLAAALAHAAKEGGAYEGALEAQSQTFTGRLSTLKDNVTQLQGALTEDLFTQLSDTALPMVMDWVAKLLEATEEGGIEGALEAAGEILRSLIDGFIENLPEIVETGLTLLEGLLEGIASALPNIIPTVVTVITTLLTGLLNHLPELIAAGFQILVGLITGIANAIPQLIAMIPTITGTIVKILIQNLPLLIQAGIQLLIALTTGLIQAIPELIMMLPQIIDAIIDAFKSTDWASIGQNIVNGIWEGIVSIWNSLVENLTKSLDQLWSWAKKILGIASPSKKFKYIGEMTTEGVIEGMEDTEAKMTRTVTDVYGGLSDTASNALTRDLNMGSIERDVSYNLTATGKLPDMTIVVPLTLDGREIARATAWSMGEQLAWEEL